MKFFLDSDYKHYAMMPDDFNELKQVGYCSLCNKVMHPHYTGEPKEVGLSDRHEVKVIIK